MITPDMKLKAWLLAVVMGTWAVLAPIHLLMYMVLLLMAVDLVTGIWKAVKLREKVTSKRARHSVAKLVGYFLAILCGFALDNILGNTEPTMARVAASAIAGIELLSIDENLGVCIGVRPLAGVIEKLKPKPKEPLQ